MKIVPNQTSDPAGGASSAFAAASTPRAPARPATPDTPQEVSQEGTLEAQHSALPAGTPQTNVTFRKDSQGQIFYVLTDAQSGKEIRQVPPEEIRKVGEGIEQYLKQQETKATTHLKTKA